MDMMKFKRLVSVGAFVTLTAGLSACGGSSSGSAADSGSVNTDYSNLEQDDIAATVLKVATQDELETHIKNGLRLQSVTVNTRTSDDVIFTADLDAAPEASPSSEGDSGFSETNTIVSGVDESDYLKYDGEHIFVSTHPSWNWYEGRPEQPRIRILETNPALASVNEVASITLDDEAWGAVGELYLVSDENSETSGLATVRNTWSIFGSIEPALDVVASTALIAPIGQDAAEIAVYDVSDRNNPELDWRFEIDGYLQDTRKIGNTLYLVSHFSPYLREVFTTLEDSAPNDEAQLEQNERDILSAELSQLLPKVRVNGAPDQLITEFANCLVPVDINEEDAYTGITTILAIDLENKAVVSGACLNTSVNGLYVSQDSVYLGGSVGQFQLEPQTVVHKFSLNEGEVNYRSTGHVPGYLSWGDQAAFRMSEHDDHFRIVKPGEDIFAVRFRGDEAFIVTFERIDPLYVLDLSDPLDPQISGELELPGFSTYLHPVNDRYLLGFGRDVQENRNAGLKISLFDIADRANPAEVSNIVLGGLGSYSEALYDLHALSFLELSDQLRFTMPASLSESYSWQDSGLHLFELDNVNTSSASLTRIGQITAEARTEENTYPSTYGRSRSVLHENAVFFSYDGEMFSSFWDNPNAAIGPQ